MRRFEKRLPDAELEIMKVMWHNQCPMSTSEVKHIIDGETDNKWAQHAPRTPL